MSGRLLFHYPVLHTGGAERSILRLTTALAERGCEVHLVLTASGGSLEPEIHPLVRVHHLRTFRTWRRPGTGAVGQFLATPLRALCWFAGRLQETVRRRRFRGMQFDAAFVGLAGLSPEFVCKAVKARRRFVFVRSDPGFDSTGKWRRRIRGYHRDIDGYICVSEYVHQAMARAFPEIAGKLTTIYNLVDPRAMKVKAEAPSPFPAGTTPVRVLTVCRLNERAKALVRMVEVHRRLLESGVHHEWHVLGEGPDRRLLEQAIADHGVRDTFRLHGSVPNPFPYYRQADICAVLSRFEGLCGVVNEARIMERAVIATRFSGVEEQIEDGVNGLIVEQDVGMICMRLRELILDPHLRDRLARGGFPAALLDDAAKVDQLLGLFVQDFESLAAVSAPHL